MNKSIEKLVGKPHNLTAGDKIGAGTEAANRPLKNSSIEGGKFTGACSMYGTEGVSVGDNGGGGSGGNRSQAAQ